MAKISIFQNNLRKKLGLSHDGAKIIEGLVLKGKFDQCYKCKRKAHLICKNLNPSGETIVQASCWGHIRGTKFIYFPFQKDIANYLERKREKDFEYQKKAREEFLEKQRQERAKRLVEIALLQKEEEEAEKIHKVKDRDEDWVKEWRRRNNFYASWAQIDRIIWNLEICRELLDELNDRNSQRISFKNSIDDSEYDSEWYFETHAIERPPPPPEFRYVNFKKNSDPNSIRMKKN